MPRRPGRTRQRWPQAKQRTAPPSTCSTSSPSRTRASSTWASVAAPPSGASWVRKEVMLTHDAPDGGAARSEEHTSELQSRSDLVCRLLLEKKKKKQCYADR